MLGMQQGAGRRISGAARPLTHIHITYILSVPIDFDPRKAAANEAKHRVTFEEAEPVLFDAMGLTREDEDAEGEPRFVTVGSGAFGRVLVVVWTERGDDYRIISARVATALERQKYEG